MKARITQNQYFGLRNDLPFGLKSGSQYIATDTGELFIYGDTGIGVLVSRPIQNNNEYNEDAFKVYEDESPLFEDNFELGNLNNYTFSGDADWVIDNTFSNGGTYSAKAGAIIANQTSSMDLQIDLGNKAAFKIKLDYYVDAEGDPFDTLRIKVDGTNVFTATVENAWTTVEFIVYATSITNISFQYGKDGATDTGADTCWIDNLSISPTAHVVSDAPTITVGDFVPLGNILLKDAVFTDDLTIADDDGGEEFYIGIGPETSAGLHATNTRMGRRALEVGASSYNTAIGDRCLLVMDSGKENTAVGTKVMQLAVTGNGNVGMGRSAMYYLNGGNNNIGIGLNAGQRITLGDASISIGYNSGLNSKMAEANRITLIGAQTNVDSAVPTDVNNSTALGNLAIITKSNQIKLGNSSVTEVLTSGQYNITDMHIAPASASDTGTLGEVRVTATAIYVCTATDTWVKADLATWV